MPTEWTHEGAAPGDAGAARGVRVLSLWPYRSLPQKGFVWFMGGTAALIAIPTLAMLGTPVLWGLLPFEALAFVLLWVLLRRSYRSGDMVEELRLAPGRVRLDRREPDGTRRDWEANPYWVHARLHPRGGPVENYITLSGGPREVEIGAFLSAEERLELHPKLEAALDDVRNA